jgi:hypothetical protein
MPVDKRIVHHVELLVEAGITKTSDIEASLSIFVQDLFREASLPARTDRRYYPSSRDIYNIIYRLVFHKLLQV